MDGLTQRMEENFGVFEAAFPSLSYHMDEMEVAILQSRVQAFPQCSVSYSINPRRFSPPNVDIGNDTRNSNHGTTPMDTKKGLQHLSRTSNGQDFASNT